MKDKKFTDEIEIHIVAYYKKNTCKHEVEKEIVNTFQLNVPMTDGL